MFHRRKAMRSVKSRMRYQHRNGCKIKNQFIFVSFVWWVVVACLVIAGFFYCFLHFVRAIMGPALFFRQLCSTFTQRLDVICLGSIYFPIQSKRANNIHYFDCFARSVHKAHTYTHKTYPFSRFQRATRSHSQITASLDEHFLGLSFFHRNQTKLKVIHFIFFLLSFAFSYLNFSYFPF